MIKTVRELHCGVMNGLTEEDLEDPSPDIYDLFLLYNHMYFFNKLGGVELQWSRRMTLCAGVCQYYGRRSGRCSIRLSEPLLKFRPRSDLIDTLLHEMIHAFLFVTQNNRDRDGHGPMFQEHMNRINALARTNITIYHSFRDEVDIHRKHIWRCTGECRSRPPFFGYVRRANNRAPGPYDFWFAQHQASCKGTFVKEAEPEGYKSKKRKKDELEGRGARNSKIAKMKNTNGRAPDIPESKSSGVNCQEVIPFSCKGYILGTSKPEATSSVQLSPLSSQPNKASGKVISPPAVNKKSATFANQSSITDHFTPLSEFKISKDCKVPERLKNSRKRKVKDSEMIELNSDSETEALISAFIFDEPAIESNAVRESTFNVSSTGNEPNFRGETNAILVNCPVCASQIESAKINWHLDTCLA